MADGGSMAYALGGKQRALVEDPQTTYAFGVREGYGFVYFIQGETTRLIKIGMSVLPLARMASFQMASPDKLVLLAAMPCSQDRLEEGKLHRKFAAHRRHGEWFDPAPEILAFIEANDIRSLWRRPAG